MTKLRNLEDLFVHQIKDLYSAETQLIAAMPKMAEKAKDQILKMAFEQHLEETRIQQKRLEQVCSMLNISLGGHTCAAMQGLIEEGNELMSEDASPEAVDAGLIAAAQRIEHYEISGYGTAAHFAERLGHLDAARLLRDSLKEEQMTDTKLNELAIKSVNVKAMNK